MCVDQLNVDKLQLLLGKQREEGDDGRRKSTKVRQGGTEEMCRST